MRKPKILNPYLIPILFFLYFQTYPSFIFAQNTQDPEQEIGLVLAGGGALGLAHVGVLEYLEELNIPIHRIGGTSMGGIVSGLYALGYDAQSLKQFTTESNWDFLLSNDFHRKKAPLEAKNEIERYLLTLSRANNQIGFTSAYLNGNNIYQMLQKFCFPTASNISFEDLSIPFYCVAVDLIKGKEVIQDSGYLPDALLTTMAIPAIFNPIERDSFLLVDGGVLNNFPAEEMRRRGADLVIGVKLVTAEEKTEFAGPFEVLGRTYEIVTEEARKGYQGECDICIEVPLQGYSVADFHKADSLIAVGRRAAQTYKKELERYSSPSPLPQRPKTIQNSQVKRTQIQLTDIQITGNDFVPDRFILNTLKLKTPKFYEFEDIQLAIEKLQASQQFKGIYYNFERNNVGATTMYLEVKEKDRAIFNVGGNYNTSFGLGILLHPQFRNWRGFGNVFDLELRISRNPYLKAKYMSNSSGLFSPFGSFLLGGDDYFTYNTDTDFDDIQNNLAEIKLGLQWNPSLSVAFGAGVEWQCYGFTEKAQQLLFDGLDDHLFNYFVYGEADILNKVHYPSHGFEAKILAKRITENFSEFRDKDAPIWLSADYKHFFSLTSNFIFHIGSQLGYNSDFIDRQYLFYQGGVYNQMRRNIIVQAGMPLMRHSARNIFAFQTHFRWDVAPIHHITLGYSNSSTSVDFDNLFSQKFEQGIYAAYGIETIFGPVELSLASPLEDLDLQFFLKAGFNF